MLESTATHHQFLGSLRAKNVWFLFAVCATLGWFWKPLLSLFSICIQSEHYSHILLIPFLSLYVLCLDRKVIFSTVEWSPWLGAMLIAAGGAVSWSATVPIVDDMDALSSAILSMVIVSWGCFLFCFGTNALRAACFGLILLIFMVPLPAYILEIVIEFLRGATAEGVDILFQLLRVPAFRQEFVFALSDISIEIAKECSGIRSSLVLLICSLVAGHLFLQSNWTRMVLVLLVIPLAVIKNSIRITVLSLLGNYVDPKFLMDSALHSRGGIPLFFLSLGVILGMIWMLRRWESGRSRLQAVHI